MSSPRSVDHLVEVGAIVGRQRAPVVQRLLPVLALRARTAGPPGTRRSCRPARPGPRGRRPRSTCCRPSSGLPSRGRGSTSPRYSITWPMPPETPILRMIARITSLAVTPSCSAPLTSHRHRLRPRLRQRLRRQHVLDLGRADADRQRAEGAVRRRVAVAADDGHAGLGQALLRPDDVDDALAHVVDAEVGHAELFDVLVAAPRPAAIESGSGQRLVAVHGRHVVVDGREREVGPAHLAARSAAAPRTPAARSPRAPGAGRCKGGRACLPRAGTTWLSQIFSDRVFAPDICCPFV